MSDVTFIDVLLSVAIGGALGWVTGGLWNLMQGRQFNGKDRKGAIVMAVSYKKKKRGY